MDDKATYYQRNREKVLNRAKQYHVNNKEEISDEEKDIKRKYGRNRYQNMSEENKQRLKEKEST